MSALTALAGAFGVEWDGRDLGEAGAGRLAQAHQPVADLVVMLGRSDGGLMVTRA